MNNSYRYILEKGSKKHRCPGCEKRRFVRYVDTETGNYIPHEFGRCDRLDNCGYFVNPYTEGYAKRQRHTSDTFYLKRFTRPKPKRKTVYIPLEVLKATRSNYEQNTFIQNLLHRVKYPFKAKDIERVISLYHIGTIAKGFRAGGATFPFIDEVGRVRAIQVKEFDHDNHTRKNGTGYIHTLIESAQKKKGQPVSRWIDGYKQNDKKVSCLFGAHLLSKYKSNPVALVEAPKTAIYGSLYFGFPDDPANFLWLAVYSLSSLKVDRCRPLAGRDVYLFPDLSKGGKAYSKWVNDAKVIENELPGTRFFISDFLEQHASEQDREQGKDLADYLIQMDWREFRKECDAVKNVKK